MRQEDEKKILQEVYRNARTDLDVIDAVLAKVYDEELAYDLNLKAAKMREFLRRSSDRLNQCGNPFPETGRNGTAGNVRKVTTRVRTMLHGETVQVARMMQEGSKKGAESLKNAVHRYRNAGIYATELAKEMIDFEEETLRKLRSYQDS